MGAGPAGDWILVYASIGLYRLRPHNRDSGLVDAYGGFRTGVNIRFAGSSYSTDQIEIKHAQTG